MIPDALRRIPRPWLFALLAVAVRGAAASTLVVVAPDGSRYLHMARLLGEGRFVDGLSVYPQNPPLYPFLITLGNAFIPNDLVAAVLVSIALGGLAVLPLYFMARAAWGERPASLAAILYAFLPSVAVLQGDAMTEGTFMFFFFASMALGWSALENRSWEQALLAGVCTALAWLARPEGMYLVPLFGLACVLRRSRFALAAGAIYLAAAFLVAYPYLTYIKAQTGRWGLSASPFAQGILGLFTGENAPTGYDVNERTAEEFGEYKAIARFGRWLGPILYLAWTAVKLLFYAVAPFLALGFSRLRRPEGGWPRALYVLAAAIGFFIPPALAFVAGTPFSYRYVLVTFVLLLPVAALGLIKAAEWARHPKALPVFMAILCAAMSVRVLQPKRAEKAGLKYAGRAILERLGPDRRILTYPRQVEYYAHGFFIQWPEGGTPADVDRAVQEEKIDALAVYAPREGEPPTAIGEHLEKTYRRLGDFPENPGRKVRAVRVYVTSPK